MTAFLISDHPRAQIGLNPLMVAASLHGKISKELILVQTGRDMNRMGIAGQLLGAAALGIRNILAVTGDYPTLGNVPPTKAVYDLDSAHIVALAREMVDRKHIYGVPLEGRPEFAPQFHVGIGANPYCSIIEAEILKITRKVTLGAEFLITQPIFDLDRTETFLRDLKHCGLPILVGIHPMKNYPTAKAFAAQHPPGMVPEKLLQSLQAVTPSPQPTPTEQGILDSINLSWFEPVISEVRKKGYATGIHLAAVRYPEMYPLILMEEILGKKR